MPKTTVSYTIDLDLIERFSTITNKQRLKRSRIIQKAIEQWLNENDK